MSETVRLDKGAGQATFCNTTSSRMGRYIYRQKYRDLIITNLTYCQQHKGLEIYAWVIMSNHIHLLIRSQKEELSDVLRDFKSYTSKKIIDEIDSCNENHAEYIFSQKFIEQKLEYIHDNPVRAGIVEKPEEHRYSSAIDYAGGKGLLEIEIVMRTWKTYK